MVLRAATPLDDVGQEKLRAFFAWIHISEWIIALPAVLLPFGLLLRVSSPTVKRIVLWVLLLWFVVFALIIGMKRIAPFRSFSGHYHVSLLALLLALYSLQHIFKQRFLKLGYLSIFACFCCWLIIASWHYQEKFAAERLYYYNTKQRESRAMQIDINQLTGKQHPTVFVSDERFYCAYVWHKKYPTLQIDLNNCSFNNQDICVIDETEHFDWLAQYTLVEKQDKQEESAADFRIYTKKQESR
jgi:hypothetical protein